MKVWRDFNIYGTVYGLGHLAQSTVTFNLPPTITQKAKVLNVRVTYADHCFTRDAEPGEVFSPQLIFNRHTSRLFCPDRWERSKLLPTIVSRLADRSRKCYITEQENYVTMAVTTPLGPKNYAVFFSLSGAESSPEHSAFLMVHSAYEKPNFHPNRVDERDFIALLSAAAKK